MKELSLRQYLIIKTLKENGKPMSSNSLCTLLNISPRTLRYEIKTINTMSNDRIISSSRDGYQVEQNESAEDLFQNFKINDYLNITKAVSLALLIHDTVSVYDMADEYYVSESTIFNIIKQLNDKFESSGLKIQKRGDRINIIGTENAKRKMLAHFFFSEVDNLANHLENFDNFFTDFTLSDINNLVNQSLQEIDVNMDTIYFKNIVISLSVALQRIVNGNTNKLNEKTDYDTDSNEYKFLKLFSTKVEQEFNIAVNESDFTSMLTFIIGSFRNNLPDNNEKIINDEEFKDKVKTILNNTFCHYGLDIEYQDFFDSFVLHIHYLLLRSKHQAFFKNDTTLSLKHSHPYIYDISVYLTYLIEKEFDTSINNDEIGLIAIYLGTIINNNMVYTKAKVICICPKYNEIRKLLVNQLKENFSNQLEVIKLVESYSEITNEDQYDFIITVVKSEFILSNAIYVSPLLTAREIHSIDNKLVESLKQKKSKKVKEQLMNYFDQDLFFVNHGLTDGKEILDFLNDKMMGLNYVPDTYLNSVLKREELASSAFFNNFAIPHALNVQANETKIAYYYSSKPIDWFGEKLHLVLLLSLKEYDENFSKIYNLLFDILMDHEMLQNLVSNNTFDEFLDYISTNI
ncbi:BglG family transcription antiterminator [Breznakia pachnodae]|uniref:Transcriptional antiterminator n=1 Tax=Breznakia pachnodae TaxID=265178 RepID=A0ABU0E000_9FIRM|nr:PTS sugar transporter subunit IIA [Breznakia pachnodae]MDQ0360217.1 transcriptional antiterminator [Breznakia pachnodae]